MSIACARRFARFLFLITCGALVLAAGCMTRLAVERSTPPAADLSAYQPVAILPPPDAPGFAGSGELLFAASREALLTRNFAVTAPERADKVLQEMNLSAPEVSGDPALRRRFGEALRSRTVLLTALSDYRSQKSYISSSTTQVWHGAAYEYQSLPTYHQGICEMKISLKMLETEKGTLLWAAEGRGRGPSGTEADLLRRLVADLTRDLPFLPAKRE
jgi:hypothetical protein